THLGIERGTCSPLLCREYRGWNGCTQVHSYIARIRNVQLRRGRADVHREATRATERSVAAARGATAREEDAELGGGIAEYVHRLLACIAGHTRGGTFGVYLLRIEPDGIH